VRTNNKNALLRETEDLPSSLFEEVLEFVRFLKAKARSRRLETLALSETALQKDWLRPEEDEAWGDL
jgi:hypothetical protein